MIKRESLIIAGLVLSVLVPAACPAQKKAAANRPSAAQTTKRIVGTWRLVSAQTLNQKGDVSTLLLGRNPVGLLMYDEHGYMSAQVMNSARPTFPRGGFPAVVEQTPCDDLKAAVTGYTAYFGTYSIDERAGVITHHVQASTNDYMGTGQKRAYEFEGDRLVLKSVGTFPGLNGEQLTSRLIWERVK